MPLIRTDSAAGHHPSNSSALHQNDFAEKSLQNSAAVLHNVLPSDRCVPHALKSCQMTELPLNAR
jgi:hypothetical protein